MSDHRWSFWKTVWAAGGLSVGGLLLLAWLTSALWSGSSPASPTGWLLWAATSLALGLLIVWSVLVAAGGLISLHRDSLEARGLPYHSRRPRERRAGAVLRTLRRIRRPFTAGISRRPGRLGLRPGELVEVQSLEEILATLDHRGTVDQLPFMPEMTASCGQQFRVLRRVEKVHDYVFMTGLRRMRDAVLLEGLRCSGREHGGCQAACQLIWKEAWLRRAVPGGETRGGSGARGAASLPLTSPRLSAGDLQRLTCRADEAGTTSYVCQMTEVARATTALRQAHPGHYLRDLIRGNVRLAPFLEGVAITLFNWVQRRRGGARYPFWTCPDRKTSPNLALDLRPGDLVKVRSKRNIEQTLTAASRNRGLWFDAEMIRYCGGVYRVASRVERLIEEKSGRLIHVTNPIIILEGVTATGEYLAFCPQNESVFWREIWLERVKDLPTDA